MNAIDNQFHKKIELQRRAEELFSEREAWLPGDFDSLSIGEIRQMIHELLVYQVELEMRNQEILREQAEQEAERGRYQKLYDLAPVGHIIISKQGTILDANLTAAKQLGRPRDDLIRQAIGLFIYKADRDTFNAHQQMLFKSGQSRAWEQRMLGQDNTIFWAQVEATTVNMGSAIPGQDNEWDSVCYMVMRDITGFKQGKEGLCERKACFISYTMSSYEGIVIADEKGKIHFWNKAAEDITGYSKEEMLKKSVHILRPKHYQDTQNPNLNKLFNTGNPDSLNMAVKSSILKKNGIEIPVEVLTSCWKDGDCLMNGYYIKDLTVEHRKKTNELVKCKFDAVHYFSGWFSHDMNKLLSVLIGNIELAMELNSDNGVKRYLIEAFAAGLSTRDLMLRLIKISQSSSPRKKSVSLPDMISMKIKNSNAGDHIRFNFCSNEDIWMPEADEELLDTVIQTVIENSVEAMPGGGEIKITLENIFIADADRIMGCRINDGAYVKASFTDSGTGISKHDLGRVFDPYFSTKERVAEEGKGLSLTLAYSIINQHNGHIEINSTEGKGTEVTFWLPVISESLKHETGNNNTAKAHESHRRVLVLDVDRFSRDMLETKLVDMGIECEFVRRGEDMVKLYSRAVEERKPVGFVILDLTETEGMEGMEVFIRLKKIDPSIRAVVMGSYFDDPVIKNYQDYGFVDALIKPFELGDFENVLKKGLGIVDPLN